jgi:hypothetical protein
MGWAGYHLSVRLAGTAIICILAAFGAAFLVARAVDHQTPARAATPPGQTTRVAATTANPSPTHKVNVELVSQFTPVKASLKPRPKPHRKHKKPKPTPTASVTPVSPSTATVPTPAPTYTPVYTPPTSAPTHSSPPHHKKSGGSGGSGTTTIGG